MSRQEGVVALLNEGVRARGHEFSPQVPRAETVWSLPECFNLHEAA